jgi:hypothetical protein
MRALVFGCLLIAAAQASAVIPDPWAVSLQASADHNVEIWRGESVSFQPAGASRWCGMII